MSYPGNIAVTYWSEQVYNDTTEDILASFETSLEIPLVRQASKYVCAIERMELSSGCIPFYEVDDDPDASEINVLTLLPENFHEYLQNEHKIKAVWIYILGENFKDIFVSIPIFGRYYGLAPLIESINNELIRQKVGDKYGFYLEPGGQISVSYLKDVSEADEQYAFPNIALSFSSDILASIFGLPTEPVQLFERSEDWYFNYSEWTPFGPNKFMTKTSRIDCGQIPSLVLLRSNLPLQSDQSGQAKVNIVTDFNIVGSYSSSSTTDFIVQTDESKPINLMHYDDFRSGFGSTWTNNSNGMIIYTPAERRWLNFSAPVPIVSIRFWIEYVTNDGTRVEAMIPPGGKFSLKLGLYLM